ncbi:hypothetical protein GE061_011489, partial [Apolygus lucorum]
YRRNPRFYDTSDDEFYDAFEAGGDVSESETLVTAGGSDSDTLVCVPSPTSSITTLASMHSFTSALSCVTSKHLHNNSTARLNQVATNRRTYSIDCACELGIYAPCHYFLTCCSSRRFRHCLVPPQQFGITSRDRWRRPAKSMRRSTPLASPPLVAAISSTYEQSTRACRRLKITNSG